MCYPVYGFSTDFFTLVLLNHHFANVPTWLRAIFCYVRMWQCLLRDNVQKLVTCLHAIFCYVRELQRFVLANVLTYHILSHANVPKFRTYQRAYVPYFVAFQRAKALYVPHAYMPYFDTCQRVNENLGTENTTINSIKLK